MEQRSCINTISLRGPALNVGAQSAYTAATNTAIAADLTAANAVMASLWRVSAWIS